MGFSLLLKTPPLPATPRKVGTSIGHLLGTGLTPFTQRERLRVALTSFVGSGPVFEESMSKVRGAATMTYDRAIQSGDIRSDINPVDHILAIVGVTFFGTSEDWKESATRLVEILIQGSRPL